MSSQPIVQWNYVIYFHIRGSFLTTFCTSFWERVHNLKEIVNIQGLFVATVGYIDVTTYSLTNHHYIIEKIYFIYRLLILFISTLSFLLFLYTVLWRYKRYYLHASIDVFFILCSILLTQWRNRNIRFFYTTFVLTIQKRSRFEPASPQSYIYSYAPDRGTSFWPNINNNICR